MDKNKFIDKLNSINLNNSQKEALFEIITEAVGGGGSSASRTYNTVFITEQAVKDSIAGKNVEITLNGKTFQFTNTSGYLFPISQDCKDILINMSNTSIARVEFQRNNKEIETRFYPKAMKSTDTYMVELIEVPKDGSTFEKYSLIIGVSGEDCVCVLSVN